MKIRHNPAGQRQQIQEFFDSSRRMLRVPRQTCVKACSWDVSEVVPNKPRPQWEIFAAEDGRRPVIGLLALDPQRWQIDLLSVVSSIRAKAYPANCCTRPAAMRKTSSF